MADQGQNYEYDQYAPQTGGRLFSSSMFGFNKEEVLEYLDELADENYQRQEAAEMQIQELTQKVQNLEAALSQQQAAPVQENPQQVTQLNEELEISKAAVQQAEDELAEVRDQLFNAQQENEWLREEHQKSDTQIAELQRQIDQITSGEWNGTADGQQMEEQRQKLEEAEQLLMQRERILLEREQQLARAEQDLATAGNGHFSELQNHLAEQEHQLAETQHKLAESERRHTELMQRLSQAELQANDNKRRLEDREIALSASQNRLIERERALAENQRQMADNHRQIAELRNQLDQTLAELEEQRNIDPNTVASAAIIADANAEAERIRAVALDEKERIRRQIRTSAGGLAESITNLRTDVSGVENDVTHVLEAVQTSLADVLAALSRTEQNLNTMGIQIERFPAVSATVPKAPGQQVVYFQPSGQTIAPEPAAPPTGQRAFAPESYGQGGFRRVWPEPDDDAKTRRFRPSYTSNTNLWPQTATAAKPAAAPQEERMRGLAENLVETLVEMLT